MAKFIKLSFGSNEAKTVTNVLDKAFAIEFIEDKSGDMNLIISKDNKIVGIAKLWTDWEEA